MFSIDFCFVGLYNLNFALFLRLQNLPLELQMIHIVTLKVLMHPLHLPIPQQQLPPLPPHPILTLLTLSFLPFDIMLPIIQSQHCHDQDSQIA